jgi:molybdate transport system substrate-binding protein
MTKLKVFCARSMTYAVTDLADAFMRETGHEVDITFGPVGTLQRKLADGETTDVLILGAPAMAMMEEKGCFVVGTRTDISRVSIGVAVREGTPVPDISSAEAFKATLLGARTIAFTHASVGGTAAVYLPQLFKGAHVIGKLPAALADDTTYTAAVAAGSPVPAAASAFIAALARPATRDVWRAAGFERAETGASP